VRTSDELLPIGICLSNEARMLDSDRSEEHDETKRPIAIIAMPEIPIINGLFIDIRTAA
jgi:hypothetical protein